jgi:hypothetical protein
MGFGIVRGLTHGEQPTWGRAQDSSGHHTRSENTWRLSTEQDRVDERLARGM